MAGRHAGILCYLQGGITGIRIASRPHAEAPAPHKELRCPMQQEDPRERSKRNFNVALNVALIYQRALVIPLRKNFGVEALRPCLFSLIALVAWSAFSGDTYMWWYTGIWLAFFAHRRWQSLK